MKHFIMASSLTIVGLVLFILYDSGTLSHTQKIPVDKEQQGLDQQIIIHFSHVVAENTPKGLAAQKLSELVYKKTEGRVKVEIYPDGILYSDSEELAALKRGDIQMIAPSYTNMTNIVPEWQILDLPFLFKNDDHIKAVFSGEISEQLLSFLDKKEMKGLAFWSNGFKQMTNSNHPLIEPEDFKNQTFRIMPGYVLKRQFNLLGAKTVTTSFTEVYSSLEKHQIDGQENTISNIYSKGLYQFQPYFTLSNHGYLGYVVIINETFWNDLPSDIKKQIKAAMKETTLWNMEQSKNMNESQLQEMKNNANITIYELPDESKQQWIEHFNPLYRDIENQIGSDLCTKIKQAGQ